MEIKIQKDHGYSNQGKPSSIRKIRNYIKKNYDCLGNNLEKACGCFKQKSSVQLNFCRSYIVSELLESAENNFCNGGNLKKSHN